MTITGLLVLLGVAGLCGIVAEGLVGFSPGGCLVAMGVGLVGAFVGSWVAQRFGLPGVLVLDLEGGSLDIVWTIVGSMIFLIPLAVFRAAMRKR
jgi:uncharacterized membrane protein YeaQ/YmgE (transglycosylase-associated protein family)